MSILNKYKKWRYYITVLKDKYWDFVLSLDDTESADIDGENTTDCLISWMDFTKEECYEINKGVSLTDFTWDGSINEYVKLTNIGFTGMDNGLLKFDKDTVSDYDFYNRLTRSEIDMISGDTRLMLREISGNTKAYSYEMYKRDNYLELKGGFLQGFYKLFGYDYQVLPQYIDDTVQFEFTIRPKDYVTKNNILNRYYPDNSGIFFYIGTRAENKFAKMYGSDLSMYPDRDLTAKTTCDNYFYDDYFSFDDIDQEKVRDEVQHYGHYYLDDYFSYDEFINARTDLDSGETFDLNEAEIRNSEGDPIDSEQIAEIETDNKFLLFDRTPSGFTADTWDEGDLMIYQYNKAKINANLFLLMNRTKTGLTADDKLKLLTGEYEYDITTDTIIKHESGDTLNTQPYDIKKDIYNNAFALKINDDMSVGYRYLVKDCDSEEGYSIEEEYTAPNMVKKDEWNVINVKFEILNGELDECGKPIGKRRMKIFIYVNGYLKLVSKELDEFNFRELDDVYSRQEAVPFNISLGGGTQGMAESIWIKYKEMFLKVLPLEQYFAGSFIGDIRSFKIYTCGLQYNQIKNNYLYEVKRTII